MEIYVDQRIELITIIQTLCNYWDNLAQKYYNKELFQCKYKENIQIYFEKYKQNETIELYKKLSNDKMDISAFLTLILNYSDPPNICKIANNNSNKYEHFINSIKTFYKETNFDNFYKNNRNEYEKLLNDFGKNDVLVNDIGNIFGYLGINNIKKYKVIISSLVFGNFGINNELYNYIIISPYDYKDNKYIFGSKESIARTIRHEIAHTVINDLTKIYSVQKNYENINIPEIFIKQFYNNIETIINEYIIRAITCLLEKDNNCSKAIMEYEIKCGFTEVENIKNYILEKCTENNKFNKENKYKELLDYVIDNISKSYFA
jgi:hypothetical protein